MHLRPIDEANFPLHTLHASNGLLIHALPNACIYAIVCDGILINQLLASPVAGGGHRIYLRVHGGEGIRSIEIIGPAATSQFASSKDRLSWSGAWEGLQYRCTCWLHPTGGGWFFHVEVQNRADRALRCDAVMVQDLGLATRGHVRNNEIFNAQYLDHVAIQHVEVGHLLMTRQNLPQPKQAHPWLMQGCFPGARGFTTDGFDFFEVGYKLDAVPRALSRPIIGGRVCQYEAAYTAIQSVDVDLRPGSAHAWTFFAHFVPDHPQPSSAADADGLKTVQVMHKDMLRTLAAPAQLTAAEWDRSVFQTCELYMADDWVETDLARHFPAERRHEEVLDDRLVSFFHGEDSRHVVLKGKELVVRRPQGHVLRAGQGFMPDGELMSSACYAAGVFASQLALGNTSLGKLISAARDPLNLVRSSGLRIFVRDDESRPWQLLGVPSAFEMAPDQCRWYYQRAKGVADILTVSCIASDADPAFTFDVHTQGRPVELLVCGEIAAGPAEYDSSPHLSIDRERGRITIRPDPESLLGKKQPDIIFHLVISTPDAIEAMGGDELLFPDKSPRGYPYFAIRTRPTRMFTFTFVGALSDSDRADALCDKYESPAAAAWRAHETSSSFWSGLTAGVRVTLPSRQRDSSIQDALTWFARDALVHLSVPRGLEQRNGGAWGVRDVCQGPVEFLLSSDHGQIVADILRKLFAQQYQRRGDWPQWFMFPPYQHIQSSHCHGDNLIWPLKALCDYLEHTNDAALLHERVPYTDDATFVHTDRPETLLEHCDRLLGKMRQEFLPGLALPRYGEGDWDDSLQPADPLLRERMVSSWTAALMYQTLRRYSAALAHFGHADRAAAVKCLADAVETDFQRYMMPDGIVAGFAIFDGEPPRPVEYLLHPSDTRTGLRYRLIPMTRGILSGIFSPRQAREHLDLIREHLLFPDGARLMDRPTTYHGGIQHTFQRSESAAFFGREIGLQYVHAHLRYAEALAMMGRADELWRALLVVNPVTVTEVVKNARPRQRNCYFSSSDAAFSDRYDASRSYQNLRRGEVPVDGGWRTYSSGPGIYTSMVLRHLLGLRRHYDDIEFDPVLPRELDGAACELTQNGRRVRYQFTVRGGGGSPKQVTVNGVAIPSLSPIVNRYRPGGVRVSQTLFNSALQSGENVVAVEL